MNGQRLEVTKDMVDHATVDIAPAFEPVTVTPSEIAFRLRLKTGRFLVTLGESRLGELQARLDRVSKYAVRRLQRKYPALGVSKPTWSIDTNPMNVGMRKYAYCQFDYIDLTPYSDGPTLVVLPPEHETLSVVPNRAARRAK